MEDEDYKIEGSEDEDETSISSSSATQKTVQDEHHEIEETDPSMAEWFHADENPSNREEVLRDETDSETEADSDNEDVTRDEDINAEDDEDNDWIDVRPTGSSPEQLVHDTSVRFALPPIWSLLTSLSAVPIRRYLHI